MNKLKYINLKIEYLIIFNVKKVMKVYRYNYKYKKIILFIKIY